MFGDFGRPRWGVCSTNAIAYAANPSSGIGHAIKLSSLKFDSRFLGDASAGDGCGGERPVAGVDCCTLEALSGRVREGFALCKKLALTIEPFNICIDRGLNGLRF